MTTEKWSPNSRQASVPMPGELIADFRTRLALEKSHAVERRRQELAEQASAQKTPEMRIRMWEQLHALALPVDLAHPLVNLIAAGTGLMPEQVQEEQRRRSASTAAKPAATTSPKIFDPYCTRSRLLQR